MSIIIRFFKRRNKAQEQEFKDNNLFISNFTIFLICRLISQNIVLGQLYFFDYKLSGLSVQRINLAQDLGIAVFVPSLILALISIKYIWLAKLFAYIGFYKETPNFPNAIYNALVCSLFRLQFMIMGPFSGHYVPRLITVSWHSTYWSWFTYKTILWALLVVAIMSLIDNPLSNFKIILFFYIINNIIYFIINRQKYVK